MVFFNYASKQLAAKIVYYGPGLSGKTTNLQVIYRKTHPKVRGELISLETGADRTLFFDLLPMEVGTLRDYKVRFQLYTVPGQVHYNETRKLVLKGVDGIVFVADSQKAVLDSNIESMENLAENLAYYNIKLEDVPLVIQYNKRDLPNILSIEELEKHLNKRGVPYYEAIAIRGIGVFETLKGISRLTLARIARTLEIHEEKEEELAARIGSRMEEEKTTRASVEEVKEKLKEDIEEKTVVVMPSKERENQEVKEGKEEEEVEVEFAVEEEKPSSERVYFRQIKVSREEAGKQLDELVKTILGETKSTPKKIGRLERRELHEVFKEVLKREKTIKREEQFDIPIDKMDRSEYLEIILKLQGGEERKLKIPLKDKGYDILNLKLFLKLIGK